MPPYWMSDADRVVMHCSLSFLVIGSLKSTYRPLVSEIHRTKFALRIGIVAEVVDVRDYDSKSRFDVILDPTLHILEAGERIAVL
jgi:hypothetical protein